MYSEYLTDLYVLMSKASLSEEEYIALVNFSRDNCDRFTNEPINNTVKSAFRKLKNCGVFPDYTRIMKAPKSWNLDFDGENGNRNR